MAPGRERPYVRNSALAETAKRKAGHGDAQAQRQNGKTTKRQSGKRPKRPKRTGRPCLAKEQWLEFQNSPFMKSMKQADEICVQLSLERDEKRKARDPEFEPDESDWQARQGTNGVSTNGITANDMFFDRGTFGYSR